MSGYEEQLRIGVLEDQVGDLKVQAIEDRARVLNLENKLLEMETTLLAHFRARGEL